MSDPITEDETTEAEMSEPVEADAEAAEVEAEATDEAEVAAEVAEVDAADEDEADEQTEEEAEQAEVIAEADLVSDEGEIKTESVAGLTDDARAAVAEFTVRLEDLALVLTDLEARNADPAAGAVIAASAKVRAHMDDVQRHLGPLSAALQAVQNEAVAK